METAKELIFDLTNYCTIHYNEENIKKYQKYFKEAHIAYGLSQKLMDDKIKELVKI